MGETRLDYLRQQITLVSGAALKSNPAPLADLLGGGGRAMSQFPNH